MLQSYLIEQVFDISLSLDKIVRSKYGPFLLFCPILLFIVLIYLLIVHLMTFTVYLYFLFNCFVVDMYDRQMCKIIKSETRFKSYPRLSQILRFCIFHSV
jgi:hypothetical protein